ncbi:MAG TPA: hypothetical protein VFZ91_07675 [Allosphingosinicella sp.]
MPYRNAWIWVVLLLPAVAVAFWPGYLTRLGEVSWILHAHGITATLWIILLAAQSWSIDRGARGLHRLAGRASLALFPLFWVSGLLIVDLMAAGFVARANPFQSLFGARLTPVDLLTSGAILLLYYVAVSRRRAVLVHASAMLAIPLFLVPPILVRLFQIGGPLAITGPTDFFKFGYGLELANLLCIALALWLYARRPKTAWPFLVAAATIAAQGLVFETLGRSRAWQAAMPGLASIPTAAIAAFGLLLSGAVVWAAWSAPAGARPRGPRRPAEALATD